MMNYLTRLTALVSAGSLFALAACASESESNADSWPPDPTTISVPLDPGGGTDILAREFATQLSADHDAEVVIENNPGGGTVVGLNELHGAEPDGSELMIIGTTIASVYHAEQSELTPDDFTMLGVINSDPPAIAVRDDAPWTDIEDFIEDARTSPDTISVASGNPDGVWDVVANALRNESDLPWRPIPTEGGAAPSVQALLANEVDAAVMSPAEMLEQVRAGNLRVLAVGSEERLSFIEDVPTFDEAGLMAEPPMTFRPVVGPPDMPNELVDVVSRAVLDVSQSNDFIEWQEDNWLGPLQLDHNEAEDFVEEQSAMYQDYFNNAE